MSSRNLFTSPDDLDYVNAFARLTPLPDDLLLLSEPLWLAYTNFLAILFDPEICLRITIFIANMLFLSCFAALTRWNTLYVLVVFVFNLYLATLFYYIQIRVGLAIGVFLLLLIFGARPIIAALVCAMLHSSFLVIVLAIIFARVFGGDRTRRLLGLTIGLFAILILSLSDSASNVISDINLGRRDGVYASERVGNVNFYIISVALFLLCVPGMKQWIARGKTAKPMTTELVAFYLLAVASSLVNEAGVRLVVMANVFAIIHLCSGEKVGRSYFLPAIVSASQILLVLNEYAKGDFGPDSWFLRWTLILT